VTHAERAAPVRLGTSAPIARAQLPRSCKTARESDPQPGCYRVGPDRPPLAAPRAKASSEAAV
jgi:hypothetical protein